MTCEEFERVLPELEGGHNIEQESHLKSCSACSSLVSDLNAISQQARLLKGSEEPSPWVWNAIESGLRQENLIRQPQPEHSLGRARSLGWKVRWLVPLAAAFLVAFGVLMRQSGTSQPPGSGTRATARLQPNEDPMPTDDLQLLNTVAAHMPSMRDAYEANLRSVNAYIRDAERSAHGDPNDEVAQQYLMNAYEQRAMVYEMALDRSLP